MDEEIDLFAGLTISRYPFRFGFDALGLEVWKEGGGLACAKEPNPAFTKLGLTAHWCRSHCACLSLHVRRRVSGTGPARRQPRFAPSSTAPSSPSTLPPSRCPRLLGEGGRITGMGGGCVCVWGGGAEGHPVRVPRLEDPRAPLRIRRSPGEHHFKVIWHAPYAVHATLPKCCTTPPSPLRALLSPSILQAMLGASSSGWLAGTPEPTVADLLFAPRLCWMLHENDGVSPTLLDGFPLVAGLVRKVRTSAWPSTIGASQR